MGSKICQTDLKNKKKKQCFNGYFFCLIQHAAELYFNLYEGSYQRKLLPSNEDQKRQGFFVGNTNAKLTDITRQLAFQLCHKNGPQVVDPLRYLHNEVNCTELT